MMHQLRNRFFIKEHSYYYTPSDYLIEAHLRARNLDYSNVHLIKELSRFFYHVMIRDQDYIHPRFAHPETFSKEDRARYEKKKAYYEELSNRYVPGYSPLDKALNFLEIIKKNAEKKGKKPKPPKTKEQLEEEEKQRQEREQKRKEQQEKENGEKEDGEKEKGEGDEGEGEEDEGEGKGKPGEEEGEEGGPFDGMDDDGEYGAIEEHDLEEMYEFIPDKAMFESSTMNMLMNERRDIDSLSKRIDMLQQVSMVEDFGKTFEVKKTISERTVPNSDRFKQKRMREYGELINSQLYQRILPHYEAKLVTKDLIVNAPILKEESKQKIIILVDYSGSMNVKQKQDWILAILADRLSYCIKEECEIFFSFFLTLSDMGRGRHGFRFHHIYNEETALKFFREYSTAPSGGDTEVGRVINAIRDEIMDNHKLFNLDIDLSKEQPEILVINDGQDSVKTQNLTWKTNAITLYDGRNSELEGLCKKTEGRYIFIDRNGPTKEHH